MEMIRWVLLACLAAFMSADRVTAQAPATPSPHPVRDVTERQQSQDIKLAVFTIERPQPYGAPITVHFGPIDEEPSIGARYGFSAVIDGQRAIALGALSLVDERGALVQSISAVPMATGVSDDHELIGMMTIPALPFRIVLTGKTVEGQAFTRTYPRLFRPVKTPPPTMRLRDIFKTEPQDIVDRLQASMDEQMEAAVAEREALLAQNAGGELAMPRMWVSNVMFMPLLSRAGAPIGLRVTYDVRFSRAGEFAPGVRLVAADDVQGALIGLHPMQVVNTTIRPLPRQTYPPHDEPTEMSGYYARQAHFLYQADTSYTFAIDLVPDYVQVQRDGVSRCFSRVRFRDERDPEKAFTRMLAKEALTAYKLSIGIDAFEGEIENVSGEGTLYRNLIADGLPDCPDRPPIGFQIQK
jgi:hypothetical protein